LQEQKRVYVDGKINELETVRTTTCVGTPKKLRRAINLEII
jgi:hypothetical protein